MLKIKWTYLIAIISTIVSGILISCTSMQVNHSPPIKIDKFKKIAILPFRNMTETPQADERAASMTANLLRTKGITNIISYPNKSKQLTLIPGVKPSLATKQLLTWARKQNASYALIGDVTEWNYKVGLDGEPAVGINLELIDVENEMVVWSGTGSKSGGSRTALSDVALDLIQSMLQSLTSKGNQW